ncbi:hypothetical protein B0J14DRAFT_604740 [Halenospora varia]|nr:hypothetical protein B0J14DRAFT_604740 [Halenospora varia]
MHTCCQTTSDFPPIHYFSLSLVILGVTLFQCIPVFLHVFRVNRTTGNTRSTGNSQDDLSWIVTDSIFRCTYGLSLLLAIGLVVFRGLFFRSLSQSDQNRFQDVLLAMLASIPRVHIVFESQFLRLIINSYQYAVWIGWVYCVVLVIVLFSLIGSGINQAITSKISLALSFVEYFVTAFGYVGMRRQLFQPRRRVRAIIYVNIISCFLVGIGALILLVLNFLVNFEFLVNIDLVLFEWAHAIVTSLFLLRFLVFYYTKEDATPSPTHVTWGSQSTSQSELIDYDGGKVRVNPQPAIEDSAWSQAAAYRNTGCWGPIEE